MRLLVATDAWRPQVNGVVRSLERMIEQAPAFGAEILLLEPSAFRTVPMPGYPEIRLALAGAGEAARRIEALRPTHVHVATEGPVGLAARRACLRLGLAFTTSYHTRFPEYLAARAPVPTALSYAALRRFHNAGQGVLAATPSLRRELAARGFRRVLPWGRGVDTELFRPRDGAACGPLRDCARPIFLCVGRVAVEKNLEAFLALDLPGTKVVVGDGPARAALRARHPEALFLGALAGERLAEAYAAADAFVFPSLTDTFGLVLLEALACGTPVAAFPAAGPLDVVGSSGCAALGPDLRACALAALRIPRERCRDFALRHGWRERAREFFAGVRGGKGEDGWARAA